MLQDGWPENTDPRSTDPHYGPVRGLPTDRSTDPSTDHPQNKIKNKNEDLTYRLSNRSLVSAKFERYAG